MDIMLTNLKKACSWLDKTTGEDFTRVDPALVEGKEGFEECIDTIIKNATMVKLSIERSKK